MPEGTTSATREEADRFYEAREREAGKAQKLDSDASSIPKPQAKYESTTDDEATTDDEPKLEFKPASPLGSPSLLGTPERLGPPERLGSPDPPQSASSRRKTKMKAESSGKSRADINLESRRRVSPKKPNAPKTGLRAASAASGSTTTQARGTNLTQTPNNARATSSLSPAPSNLRTPTPLRQPRLQVLTARGTIFDSPPRSILIHACNCAGVWGSGIAAAFRMKYPTASKRYTSYCKNASVKPGTALLIPPSAGSQKKGEPRHYIGCLFTSKQYGKQKDPVARILGNTGPAMLDLLRQIRDARDAGEEVGGLKMCQINSGRFGVPWEETLKMLKAVELEAGMDKEVTVVS